MPFRQKIWISIMLLLLVIPAAVGIYLQVSTWIVQHEMKERLEKEKLTTIFLPHHQVHFYAEHELLIDGKMFDVKSVSNVKDGIVVTGLYDTDEDHIKAKATCLGNHSAKTQKAKVYAFFQLIFHPADGWLLHCDETASKATLSIYKAVICDNTYPVIVPPPQVNSI